MPFDFIFWQNVVLPLAGGLGLFIFSIAVIRAVARHFERRHEARMAGGAAVGQMEGLQKEFKELRSHVEALEERVEFAERLLTKERARPPLEPGR